MSDCALLNSSGMRFDGTFGTIGGSQCLFSGVASETIMKYEPTLTVTRRIRWTYSSWVVFGGAIGIDVSTSASILTESYILDFCNFSGGSPSYLVGILYTDNRAFHTRCKNIPNSSEIGQMYFFNSLNANSIGTTNIFEKISGITTASAINQKFSHTDNRLTYTGGLARSFKVTATCSASSQITQTITILVRVAKNSTTIPESESQATTSAVGRSETFLSQCIIEMNTGDFVELWVANATNANGIAVSELNLIIEALN